MHECDMLKTRLPERAMRVTTWLHTTAPRASAPWTAVWHDPDGDGGPSLSLEWLHFWPGPTTPGGLAEAHEAIVAQVERGLVPAQCQDEEEGQHAQLADAQI
jgi:hypothetical protein